MQVILLAAGQSTRLDPISDKNTLEFCGKPLIEHQVSVLKQAKMRDIAVVANQFNIEKITEILKKYSNVMVVEQKKLEDGMAGGVLAGASMVKHKNIMIVSTPPHWTTCRPAATTPLPTSPPIRAWLLDVGPLFLRLCPFSRSN